MDKSALTVCVVVLIASLGSAGADEMRPLSFRSADQTQPRNLRIAGIVLTTIGVAAALTGTVLLVIARTIHCSADDPREVWCTPLMVMGAGFAGGSTAFLGSGIPLWVVGDRRLKRFAVAPVIVRRGVSAMLTLRFD